MAAAVASSPCHRCKVKKSKCDKVIPSCRRCLKSGVVCPGYPDVGSTIFRTMNDYAEQKVKARLVRRTRLASDAASPIFPLLERHGEHPPPTKNSQLQPVTVPPYLTTNWHEVAIPRFMVDYIWPSHKVPGGSLNFLPEILREHPECRFLRSAMQAVALISLANQNRQTHLLRDAECCFLEAISGVSKALLDIKQAKSDTVVATTFLFSLYAMLIDQPAHKYWNAEHHRGAFSLLRIRGDSQFSTPMARNLYKMNHTQLMVTCLAAHIRPPMETYGWLKIIEQEEPRISNELSWCKFLAAQFCANVQDLFDSPTKDEEWVLNMLSQIKEAMLIDERLQSWIDKETTGVWSQKQVRSRAGSNEKGPVYVYHNLIVGFTWSYYRATRLHINEVLRHCIKVLTPHLSSKDFSINLIEIERESTRIIAELISGIRASASFCLGDIDSNGNEGKRRLPLSGRAMIWPLYRAIRSAEEGSEDHVWLIGKLQFISDVLGQKLAGRLLDRPRVYSWDIR